jgi:extradiol dioxygenase
MLIKSLGYIGIDTTHPGSWRDLANSVLAFEAIAHARGSADAQYFRLDGQHHRVSIYTAAGDRLRYLGWEVDTGVELRASVEKLRAAGITVTPESADVAAERCVRQLVSFQDSEGFRHELYWGALHEERPFEAARPLAGFVTAEEGLGHAVLAAKDAKKMASFFCEVLGFKVSDTIDLQGIDITFLRCNRRHHSLAIMTPAQGTEAGQMHHVMFELKSLDDLGVAYDLVQEKKIPLILSLGRHINDRMVSFYFRSPSSVGIELGYGAIVVPEGQPWSVVHYTSTKIWGHQLMI